MRVSCRWEGLSGVVKGMVNCCGHGVSDVDWYGVMDRFKESVG